MWAASSQLFKTIFHRRSRLDLACRIGAVLEIRAGRICLRFPLMHSGHFGCAIPIDQIVEPSMSHAVQEP